MWYHYHNMESEHTLLGSDLYVVCTHNPREGLPLRIVQGQKMALRDMKERKQLCEGFEVNCRGCRTVNSSNQPVIPSST